MSISHRGFVPYDEISDADELGRLAVPRDSIRRGVMDGDGDLEPLVGSASTGQKLGSDAGRRHTKYDFTFGPQPIA